MKKAFAPHRANAGEIGNTSMVSAEIVPLDSIYSSQKFADMHREGLAQYGDVLRVFGLKGLESHEFEPGAECICPFTCSDSEYYGPWKQDKNRRSMHLFLDANGRKMLVAKGIGNFDPDAEERDGKSPMPIQVSRWFLSPYVTVSYGLTLSYGRASFNAAIAYKMECEKHGRVANTLDPIALVKLETIPLKVKDGLFIEVPTEKCFEWQLDGVSKEDRLVYGRKLRRLGADTAECQSFFNSIVPAPRKVAEKFYAFMAGETGLKKKADVLREWRPIVSMYAAESANIRVGTASPRQILEENGIEVEGDDDNPKRMRELANEFTGKLAQSAFFHRAGGNFGGINGELDMRNVSVRGAVMDLDACTLPGGKADLKKQGEDREAARETIRMFCRKTGMFPPEVDAAVAFFDAEYMRNLALRQTKE